MHSLIVAALFVSSALAGDSCPAPPKQADHGNFAPGPGKSIIPNFNTHTWSRIAPSAVASELSALAQQSPGAVAALPGVASLLGGLMPQVTSAIGGYLTSSITPPEGCTFLTPTTTATSAAAATGGSGSSAYSTSDPTTLQTKTVSSVSSSASSSSSSSASSTDPKSSNSKSASSSGSSSASKSSTTSSASTSADPKSTTATSTTKSSTTKASSTHTSSTPASTKCANPVERKEWRNMSPSEQQALVDANKCLMLAPPRGGLSSSAKSRWDELVVIHQQMVDTVHGTGSFFAWHRQFLWVYEQELKTYCNYGGAIAWWDETKDAGNYHSAPMMTSTLYGSAPVGKAQCITNGAYGSAVMDIGPGSSDTAHCLARGVDEGLSSAVDNNFVNSCSSWTDFWKMENCHYLGVHAYTHDALGGVMSDIATSPGDPLFFLHHGFVDRIYRNWQLVDPSTRTYDIGGYTTQSCSTNNGGSGCTKTSLNDVLSTLGYSPDVTIGQVSDTQGGHLCYYYDY